MMKRSLQLLLCTIICTIGAVSAQPFDRFVRPFNQPPMQLTEQTQLRYQPALAELAEYLQLYINVSPANDRMSADRSIVLSIDPALAAEGYRLQIRTDHIAIEGGDRGGVFNGIQALLRRLPAAVYTKKLQLPVAVACGSATDAPRFPYRGMMLDVARTWMPLPEVKRYIDLLAYHNINKLHLHLTDDEGWRIEIKSHPELTQIGGYRGGDSPIRAVYGKWDEKYGGYFTQEQMRELIAYAAVRNIEIIPEIDLPGHSRDIASVHPEIRCNFPPDLHSTNGYDYRSAWCVAREENYTLLKEILTEICALFPSKLIHVGGDEVDMSQWEQCPDCRALMQRESLTEVHQLEDLFMNRIAEILVANGKTPAVWNEAIRTGTLSHESRVYGWESVKACLDATQKGYPTVVMPGEYCYLDMRQTPTEDGHDWAAVFDAKKTYGFDFAKSGFSEEQMQHVIGMQGAFWSEAYISHQPEKPDYIDYMCFPRLCALSAVAWGGQPESWSPYYQHLTTEHYDRMDAMGIRYRLFPPKIKLDKTGMVTATTDDRAAIYYTIDNGKPQRYLHALRVMHPEKIAFFTQRGTGRSPEVRLPAYYRTVTPAVHITTSMGESTKFPYTNAETYKGISRTSRACRQQDWILYQFENPLSCREIFVQTGNRQLPKTIVTTGEVEISEDGTQFEKVGELTMGRITLTPQRPIRAIRIRSTCNDNGTPFVTIQPLQIKPVL